MRAVAVLTSTVCALVLSIVPGYAQRPGFKGDINQLENNVLAALNVARVQPRNFVETLMNYRGLFHANLVVDPANRIDTETREGVVPVDEAIDFLDARGSIQALEPSETLRLAAADLLTEQSRDGGTGHFGANGSTPIDRSMRHGGGRAIAEIIAYGASDGEDVIRQLVIDDGVADRGHRIVMFSDHLRYAGVACGPHPKFGTMCVIDLADTPDARSFGNDVRVASFSRGKPPR